ncbi:MAG: glycoside hydrolase family 127 protein [Limisphaerales bacterium]
MKRATLLLSITLAAGPCLSVLGAAAPSAAAFVKLRAVPFTEVQIADSFWAPRRETNQLVSIPLNFDNLEKSGNLENFRLAAQRATNGYTGPVFMDSDVYKALEAASYCLATNPDPVLAKRVEEIIALLAAAQQPDGYLDTYYTVKEPGRRWTNLRDNHELYCGGHMIEAAVAHYQATGQRTFLNIATKYADYVDSVFGPGKRMGYPGHPELELALVKLWRATGERRYFDLARFFIENRGRKFFAEEHHTPLDRYDGTYWQDDMPIFDHRNIKGHAVRATYLLSGVVDVMGETGDPRLIKMVERVWRNTTQRNMYVTGGIGSSGSNEGFTTDYDLPNLTAYQETCASVAMCLWNHRLALLYGDARYADVLERSLYNGVLDGVALDGKRFFYGNPLASIGRYQRSGWFSCACCPPNVARTLASLGGYAYAVNGDALYLNLFIQGRVNTTVAGQKLAMEVATDYPWDGKVTLKPEPASPVTCALHLRVPGWCEGATVSVNGEKVADPRFERGYFVVSREWHRGDAVELNLPMPVRLVAANPEVKADHGCIAIQRGPIVYCLESCDQSVPLSSLYLPANSELQAEKAPELLGGVTIIKGLAALASDEAWKGRLYQALPPARQAPILAIPYYAWGNRKSGAMQVWLPVAPPTAVQGGVEIEAKVLASYPKAAVDAIHDGIEPKSSRDHPGLLCHFWPHKGGAEWVQYTWKEPVTVSGSKVYWFDDTGSGECRPPQSWQVEYLDGGDWKPVNAAAAYPVALDKWCEVTFAPVMTTSLRLKFAMQPNWSVGIHEWKVVTPDED